VRPRDVIVIGGSAGAIEPLKVIIRGLPADFPAAVLVVIHVSPDSPRMLASLLANAGPLPATCSIDRESLQGGHVFVCRPDHHLTIEDGELRVLHGPRENRHRPAIDPLLRSAARVFGRRALGVVLSGLQDDGSAGLYAIKQRGGITVVQDPEDADWKDMPSHAIEYVEPHYVLPAVDISQVLVRFTEEQGNGVPMAKKTSSSRELVRRNGQHKSLSASSTSQPDANRDVAYFDEGEGVPSVFACPECHGVLWELRDDKMLRFRCRVGHSYGTESLNDELSSASETALWAAVRALEEKAALSRRVAETMARDRNMSARLLDQSTADIANARLIRDMIFDHDRELEGEAHASKKTKSRQRKTA
jgi:two-component system, chemotaxis family, protein-glutamate methylesterase/glutaminase